MEEYLQVGVIAATQGLKGEVRVYPTTDDISRFDDLDKVFLETDRGLIPLEMEHVRYYRNVVILKFKGRDRIEDVETFRKKALVVRREDAIPLEPGEYYVADLIGIRVVEDTGRELGTLKEVLPTGSNDVYLVQGDSDEKRELMIPAIKDCIKSVDLENHVMTVHLLSGLE